METKEPANELHSLLDSDRHLMSNSYLVARCEEPLDVSFYGVALNVRIQSFSFLLSFTTVETKEV